MHPVCLFAAATVLCLSACRREPAPDLHGAVLAALAPECSARETREALSNLSIHAPPGLIAMSLGTNNFTTFFLTLPADSELFTSGRFLFTAPQPLDPARLALHLSQHLSVAASTDIRELKWTRHDDRYQGSFSVETPYGLRASFLFAAGTRDGAPRIDRLVVKRNDADTLEAGFPVFPR